MNVKEHEITIMNTHEYRKTWGSIVAQNLQRQMEPENIADKYKITVIKKDEVVWHLMNAKSGKFCKNCIFFPEI